MAITPGPWNRNAMLNPVIVYGEGSGHYAVWEVDEEYPNRVDDARLISAAPSLLFAAQSTIEALEAEYGEHRTRINFKALYEAVREATKETF